VGKNEALSLAVGRSSRTGSLPWIDDTKKHIGL
jgi:hypothetical protein